MLRAAAIVLAGVIALWISIGITLNFTVATRAPQLAAIWWPNGVAAQVAMAQRYLTNPQTLSAKVADQTRTKLREAALREPLNADALGALAALDEYRGDPKRARALFLAAETVSRRNTLVELWLIEDAVRRGDVPAAINHYNRAMLVSNDSRRILLPVLAGAASDPAVSKELMPVLARRPLWWKDYLRQLAMSSDNARTMTASLLATRVNVGVVEEAGLAQMILQRMVSLKAGHAAVFAANRLEGLSGSTRSLRDPGFDTPVAVLPFAWWLRDETAIRAYRDTVPNGSIGLRVVTSSGTGGGVAQQLIGLAAGRYVLTGEAGGVSTDPTTRPSVNVICEGGASLSQVQLPASDDAGRRFRATFMVPARGCTLQWVTIVTAPAADTDAWFDNFSIRPANDR